MGKEQNAKALNSTLKEINIDYIKTTSPNIKAMENIDNITKQHEELNKFVKIKHYIITT